MSLLSRFPGPAAIPWRTRFWPRRTGASSNTDPKDATFADRAGEEAGLALASNQSYAPAHVVLAMINYGQGRYDGALGEAQRAVALDAKNGRAWRELGRVHFRLGRRAEAEKAFLTAVKLDPNDWTAHNSLGSYYNVNRLDEAIAEFERMQALAPDNTRAYNNLGSAFLQQERFDKASEMYERSLSLEKTPPPTPISARRCISRANMPTPPVPSKGGGLARRRVCALVQSRRRVLLGAGHAWAREGGLRTAVALGEEARSATPRWIAFLTELASGYAVLALLTPGPAAEEPRRTRAKSSSWSNNSNLATPACSRPWPQRTRNWETARKPSTGSSRHCKPATQSRRLSARRGSRSYGVTSGTRA